MYSNEFVAPGPGVWELETAHLSRPISRWIASVWPPALQRGFADTARRYGFLVETMEFRMVNGFAYGQLRPVGAPAGAKGPPPKLIFKLLTKLHPEIRRRLRRCKEVFATKSWREDVHRWDNEWRGQIIERNRALQAVDPQTLDSEGLMLHLRALLENLDGAIYRHHSLNAVAMVAPGDFLVHAEQWTGRPASELLALLRGASQVSLGAHEEFDEAIRALQSDPAATAELMSDDASGLVLDRLLAREDEVGRALAAYVAAVAYRIMTGYDVADNYVLEMPELLLGALRAGLSRADSVTSDEPESATARIREQVPTQHRDAFDEMLAEARATFRIRDERTYHNDAWATGLMRRALLVAGARLADGGRLDDPSHVVDLTPDELFELIAGRDGPSADTVAAYAEHRTTKSTKDAPPYLGGVPSAPPPPEWLPPHGARMARCVMVNLRHMFEVPEPSEASTTIRGLAASPGVYEGPARIVVRATEFGNIRPGDVLVARTTAPSYNVLLPMLGALVTDRGGLLSHAAIVAREYGLPGVVGCSTPTSQIPDGARVRVDGTKGTVEVLE